MGTLSKNERILQKVSKLGDRKQRKREKHSDNFNRMFSFFYQIVRKEICDFCGSDVSRDFKVIFDPNGVSAKVAFKAYENGAIKDYVIVTRHPNLIIRAITGKRGWGLWVELYAQSIADCTFTKIEVLDIFLENNIQIPESFLNEFEKLIWKKRFNIAENILKEYDDFKIKLYKDTYF